MIKTYYRIGIELTSPLMIGNGTGSITDKDIVRDSAGMPYIPGTAVAGVLRHSLNKKEAERVFGLTRDEEAYESSLITYDAVLKGGYNMSVRDCVKLDDNKVAVDGAKFDFEVVEPGAQFITYLEHDDSVDDETVSALLSFMAGPLCTFGAKTSRGYGAFEIVSLRRRSFDMAKDADSWLDFDLFDDSCWEASKEVAFESQLPENSMRITLNLEQVGGISIRRYSTRVSEAGDKGNGPDSVQLFVKKGDKEIPVIPGTSWAGAFRSRMGRFLKGEDCSNINLLFGSVNERLKTKEKSSIVFSETQLNNAVPVINTRTAIDRFTGGSLDKALFKEKTYYYGNGSLDILISETAALPGFETALAAAITDLHLGLLAIGGLTSVGRGLFKVKDITVNDNLYQIPNEDSDVYNTVLNAIVEGGRQ